MLHILPTPLVFEFDIEFEGLPLECEDEIWQQKTRIMGLPYGEEIMIVGRTVWAQSTSVTDGRADIQADRFTITRTSLCIASCGKNAPLAPYRACRRIHLSPRIIGADF